MQVAHGELRLDIRGHARSEIGAAVGIERNHENAAQDAAVERGNPFGAVLGPQDHAVAGADVFLFQQRCETAGEMRDVAVSGNAAPVALVANHRDLAIVAAKVLN